ncbi:MAG: hypothetical protein JOY77_08535 [Alphaproteobacteria bacterium]|nr:hypothetical protein [Alphaproteobacteria bacterium]MBV9062958.1 hypothetical protein [Alphaproteobacteria bacterium]
MSARTSKPRFMRPANDNGSGPGLKVYADLFVPSSPMRIEVEVIAELLESLPPPDNDNGQEEES